MFKYVWFHYPLYSYLSSTCKYTQSWDSKSQGVHNASFTPKCTLHCQNSVSSTTCIIKALGSWDFSSIIVLLSVFDDHLTPIDIGQLNHLNSHSIRISPM